ncbi:MAG: chemotaxis protein CheW [Pseudomonadota bacterium]
MYEAQKDLHTSIDQNIDKSLSENDIHSPEARHILEERTKSFAQIEEVEGVSDYQEYIRFRLGDKEHYGIAYPYLAEIVESTHLTFVPTTPDFIAGVINLRSKIIPVIDLKKFFHVTTTTESDSYWIVIVHEGARILGMLVDEVLNNERYAVEKLSPALPSKAVSNLEYVQGIYEGKTTVLNVSVLLNDAVLKNMNEGVSL